MSLVILLITLCLLILISGLCSASETSLFSLSSMKVKSFQEDSDKRKRLVAHLLANPRDLMITVLMVNICLNILVQNVVSNIFGDFSTWILNVGVPLVLTLIFGDLIPKSLAIAHNAAIAYRVAPFLQKLQKILLPIRWLLNVVTSFLSRVFVFFLRKEPEISIDELQHALRTSHESGIIQDDEAELIDGYLSLEESTVKSLMRPREDVLYFDLDESLDHLAHLFVDQECSRIPVCEEGLDKFLGMMTSKVFFLNRGGLETTKDLIPILEKPFFVPEAMPAKSLLQLFYEKKETLAMVVDEYGSVTGLIALEDLVEVVIGEISDRREDKNRYTRSSKDVIIASGKLELAEFEEIFDVTLITKNHMVTLGGWLTEQVGDIPKPGTKYTTDDFLFHVLAADPQRVRRIYVRRLKSNKK